MIRFKERVLQGINLNKKVSKGLLGTSPGLIGWEEGGFISTTSGLLVENWIFFWVI